MGKMRQAGVTTGVKESEREGGEDGVAGKGDTKSRVQDSEPLL